MISLLLMMLAAGPTADSVDRGISESLARERAAALSGVRYELTFTIPADRQQPVEGTGRLRATLPGPRRIVIDFSAPTARVHSVRIGDTPVVPVFVEDHLIIPAEATRAGENSIVIAFTAGDEALNRNDDFLYTLFVPARAHLAFPCFDQPDLKGRYTLTLVIPDGWQVVPNASEAPPREMVRTSKPLVWADMVRFAETEPLPTY